MPPSRTLKFTVDPEVQRRLESHLRLKAPVRVRVRQNISGTFEGSPDRAHGMIDSGSRLIVINLGQSMLKTSRLSLVQTEVLITLLHEFRHAHQYDHWTEKQLSSKQSLEEDAEKWAQQNVQRWRDLGRVSVKGGGSPLRRLRAAERSSRP